MAALHSTAHVHIDIVPDICTLTYTFACLQSSDNQGSDNRDWTVVIHGPHINGTSDETQILHGDNLDNNLCSEIFS